MLVGYASVSTLDQNLDLQRDSLTRAGCERLFEEKKSGKAGTKRPEFEAALTYLRPTDVLVVWKLDRLGRSLVEMVRTIDSLRKKEIHFRSLSTYASAGLPTAPGGHPEIYSSVPTCFGSDRSTLSDRLPLAAGLKAMAAARFLTGKVVDDA